MTADLVWVSDLDGFLDAGGSFSSTLSFGTHIISASVTDSGLANGSDSITVDVVDPSDATVTLTDLGSVNQGRTWVGSVEIGFSGVVEEVTWSWSTGGGGTCSSASQPCTATTGELRRNVGSATLTIVEVFVAGVPTGYIGSSEITVTKP